MSKDLLKSLLKDIETAISDLPLDKKPVELYDPIKYFLALGGKRIRPLLVLLSYQLFKKDTQSIIKPALSVEVFHNFTLIHDDIMDQAPKRRGQPTVHTKWNENVAILSGDVTMVEAYDLLTDVDSKLILQILKNFNQTAKEVCEGQQWDMNFEKSLSVTIDEYTEMIRLKTAVLLAYSMQLGAILANASVKDQQLLYQIGINMGLAFQIKDDILDAYGDGQKTGKQVGGDILANKKTYLSVMALQKADNEQLESLKYWFTTKNLKSEDKIKAVMAIYQKLDIENLSITKTEEYYQKGISLFDEIDSETKAVLVDVFEGLMGRES